MAAVVARTLPSKIR